jgi:hypothetical protein
MGVSLRAAGSSFARWLARDASVWVFMRLLIEAKARMYTRYCVITVLSNLDINLIGSG